MRFKNHTPHPVRLTSGVTFDPEDSTARIEETHSAVDKDGVTTVRYGDVVGLPSPQPGIYLIVSRRVLDRLQRSRGDLVAPASGHPETQRDRHGHVVGVPCFIRIVQAHGRDYEMKEKP